MFEWTDKYASGCNLIDEQHKELFRRVDLLFVACRDDKGKQEVETTLQFIGEYVQFHFSTEEQLMKKYNFPGYQDHKLEHDQLVKKFLAEAENVVAGKFNQSNILQFHVFLVGWVCDHTLSTDKLLGAFLKACNVDNDPELKLQ